MLDHDPFQPSELDGPAQLSPAGELRRQEMLIHLEAQLRRRRRRRLAARVVAAVGVVLAASALALRAPRGNSPREGEVTVVSEPATPRPVTVELESIEFEVVHNTPGIAERYGVERPAVDLDVLVDDRELQELLATVNCPSGLVRLESRVYLATDITRASARRGDE